jgi:hypothetical protein
MVPTSVPAVGTVTLREAAFHSCRVYDIVAFSD